MQIDAENHWFKADYPQINKTIFETAWKENSMARKSTRQEPQILDIIGQKEERLQNLSQSAEIMR